MRAIEDGTDPGPTNVDWAKLQAASTFVVQDLLPFHGRTSGTLPSEFKYGSTLWALSNATIVGVRRSSARGVFVFSRQGYRIFETHCRRTFVLKGQSKKGHDRIIDGYVGCVGQVPIIALDNEFIAQPKFSYDQALPQLFRELCKENLI